MTLFDCSLNSGRVLAVTGDDGTARRLADLGLLGSEFCVKAKKGEAMLVEFAGGVGRFSAVIGINTAKLIKVEG